MNMMFPFPRFNEKQIEKLSDLSSDVGLVALASVVLPAVFDKFNPAVLLLGSIATLAFWALSIWLRR